MGSLFSWLLLAWFCWPVVEAALAGTLEATRS